MNISVYNEASWLCPLPKHVLQALLVTMYTSVMTDDDAVSEKLCLQLHVVRDASMATVNALYMQGHGPTNILSFPAMERVYARVGTQCRMLHEGRPETQQPDILVLSVDTLLRECFLYGQPVLEHTVRLLAHGLGHVLGYDHGEEMDALCSFMEERGRNFLALP